ncbi:MAG TPA: Holliday junction resolvase RuvX [Acidobacteria bacterium]|jgi:putative Holliday junction resolvase|nr:Holliday junction resolvase RuvX [Acidobacteriota bacterium]
MRIVGLDMGRKRIGVALSDVSGTLATPWRTLDGTGSVGEVAHRLVTVLGELADSEDGVGGVVVGLPSHLDGRPHEGATWVRQVADAVRLQAGLPVALQDERLTSVEAEQRLAVREHDWRKRKARLDAAAAAVFLQEYLDAHPRDTAGPVS